MQETVKAMSAAEADAMMDQQVEAQTEVTPEAVPEKVEQQSLEGVDKKNWQEGWTTELLNLELSQEELAHVAVDIADLTTQKNIQEAEFKKISKAHKSTISDLDATIDSQIQRVDQGYEKEVRCLKRIDFDLDKVIFHNGAGETYLERAISDDDRQLKLTDAPDGDSFASEQDARDCGAKVNYDETHANAKVQEEASLDDSGETLEPITEETLTSNDPVCF